MNTINTTHGYTDDPAEREAIRQANVARAVAEAEAAARRMNHSIKCGNWYRGSEAYHKPKHRTDPDGCTNDGRTCLCPCHDGQRAWQATPADTVTPTASEPTTPATEFRIVDNRTELRAYAGDHYLGGASRAGVVGSRGRSWYWLLSIVGQPATTVDNKAQARAALLALKPGGEEGDRG